jgi:hypothetical protein
VKQLLIGLSVAYVLQLILERWLDIPVTSLLAMSPGVFAPWQLLTYVLVDLNQPLMFMIGLVFMWWALSPFEIGYGAKRTLQLCLVAAISASVPAFLFGYIVPGSPLLYGSYPLWFGGIAAVTWLYRDQQVSFFGLLTMTARQFLLLLLGMSVLMFLFSRNHTQLIADLGAIGGGIGFVRWMKRPRSARPSRKPPARTRGFKVIRGGGGASEDDDRPKWLN